VHVVQVQAGVVLIIEHARTCTLLLAFLATLTVSLNGFFSILKFACLELIIDFLVLLGILSSCRCGINFSFFLVSICYFFLKISSLTSTEVNKMLTFVNLSREGVDIKLFNLIRFPCFLLGILFLLVALLILAPRILTLIFLSLKASTSLNTFQVLLMLLAGTFSALLVGNLQLSEPLNVLDKTSFDLESDKLCVIVFLTLVSACFFLLNLVLEYFLLCNDVVKL